MSRHERNIPEYVFDNLDNLKREALRRGYMLKDLGAVTGINPNYIGGLALGRYTPTRDKYNQLAIVFHWKEWE